MKISETKKTLIISTLCLAYILLRFWSLTSNCLWFDEIFSVHAAEHQWNELFTFVARDIIHPPLFYILLKIWIAIGSEEIYWLRLLPMLFSVLAIVPFLMICKELKLKLFTVSIALTFFAANGALIKYAQEVRMYSLLLFLSLSSMWLFTRFFIKGKSFAALVIVNVLLIYSHYFGWFVVLSEVAAIVTLQRIKIRQMLLMFGMALAAFVPWTVTIAQSKAFAADAQQNIGWMARPGFMSLFDLAADMAEPFYFQQTSAEPSSLLYISIPLLLIIGAAKLFYLANWKNQIEKNGFYLLSIFIGVPILLVFIASWILPISIWGSRHLIIIFAPFSILAAIFLASINIKIIRAALISASLLVLTAAFVVRLKTKDQQFVWCTWGSMAAELTIKEKRAADPVNIYTFEDIVAYHLWFALRNSDTFQVNVVKGIEGLTEDRSFFIPRGFDSIKTISKSEIKGDKAWIVFRGVGLDKPPMTDFLDLGYKVVEQNVTHNGTSQTYMVLLKKSQS